jgi:hypothetical protein
MRPTALVVSTLLVAPTASASSSEASRFTVVASTPAPATAAPTLTPMSAQVQPQAASPIFRIEIDEFWLNLRHFLYVLGQAESKAEDASREAVAGAPAESRGARGLVAVLSHQYWKRRFKRSDAAIVRSSVRINGHPLTIVGATRDDFTGRGWDPCTMCSSG